MDIRIFVVEDDEHIGSVVRTFLEEAGYRAELCADGRKALERLYDERYQLVILDIMLPGTSGMELLRELRNLDGSTPVLMMTALSGDEPQIKAFDRLADDYLTKPFSMRILLKRVEALLRRSGALQNELHLGELCLNQESYRASWAGTDLGLTLREFEILKLLAENSGRVMSHDRILSRLWGFDSDATEATVHTHIKNLRAKLPVNIIKTLRGVGYSLEEKR
ncbi:MAG: response regulator transcription factor [Treponema sp.]|jgi:two-component system response regulator VanR|nr:response regulator transcription factor [Treponema sp.]